MKEITANNNPFFCNFKDYCSDMTKQHMKVSNKNVGLRVWNIEKYISHAFQTNNKSWTIF